MKKIYIKPYSKDFYWAVRSQQKEKIMSFLLYQNLKVDGIDNNGNTVLHLVLKNKNLSQKDVLELFKIFLKRGININSKNVNQESALHLAVVRRLKSVVDYLLSQGAIIDKEGWEDNLITHHFIIDEYEKFKDILESKYNTHHFVCYYTAEKQSASFVEWLIEEGFSFDARNYLNRTAIDMAINRNLLHILPVLLKYTKDKKYFSGSFKTVLRLVTDKINFLPKSYYERHFCPIVQILLDKMTKYVTIKSYEDFLFIQNVNNRFPKNYDGNLCAKKLFDSLVNGCYFWPDNIIEFYLKILKAILAKHSNLNLSAMTGSEILIRAIDKKCVNNLNIFENLGVNFHIKLSNGQNLLKLLMRRDFQTCSKSQKMFDFLVKKGCDVNSRDNNGISLLHLAVEQDNIAFVKKLIEHNAIINCKDVYMRTPLNYLINNSKKNSGLCILLLENGANLSITDYWMDIEYSKEIKALKNLFLKNNISLYDFLHMGSRKKLSYVKNEKLKELIDDRIALEEKFPKYSFIIFMCYQHSADRKKLLVEAEKVWSEVTGIYLPDICVETILHNLDNFDLINFIETEKISQYYEENIYEEIITFKTIYSTIV